MRWSIRTTGLAAAGVVLAAGAPGCGSSGSSGAAPPVGCSTQGEASSAESADYRYVLDVGPVEEMYSAAEVANSHPKTGEVMLQGTMSMAQGPDARHVEVHICSRRGSRVVVGAAPNITLTDTATGTTVAVPVAIMQGVTSGESDLHYGNNVVVPPRHAFIAHVDLRGQQGSLPFARPG
jgi:hypothetical protein